MKFDTKQINIFGGCLQVKMPFDQAPAVAELQAAANAGKVISVEVKVKKRERSLNANAYCWKLCSSIAEKLPTHTDEDVYREAIRKAGVREYLALTDKALERFSKEWGTRGIGCFVERLREAKNMAHCSTVAVYYGSSQYDTGEMARLLDYLTEEAKSLGCDIISEADRQLLLEEWGRESGRHKVDKDSN